MLNYYDKFCPDWLHSIVKDQLLSPQTSWHYPNFGYDIDLNKACFGIHPFKAEWDRADWRGVESLTYVLDWWLTENQHWFTFEGLNRCLVNLYTPGQNTGWHVDHVDAGHYSLLYYVNDADGGTEFEDKKILQKENSGVFFDSGITHSPISSTVPRRINVNWILKGRIRT